MHPSSITLKKVTRKTAECLFKHLALVQSNIDQNKNEIRVIFEFSDDTILIVKYNHKNFIKTYYISKN